MNKKEPPHEVVWTEPWREMLYKKALAAGKKLPKVPRIIPMKRIDINRSSLKSPA